MGIRAKLLLPMLLSALAFVFVINGYVLPDYEKEEVEHIEKIHALTLHSAASLIASSVESGDLAAINSVLKDYVSLDYGVAGVVIEEPGGRVLYSQSVQTLPPATRNLEGKILSGERHVGNIRFIIDEDYCLDSGGSHVSRVGGAFVTAFLLIIVVTFFVQDGFIRRPIKNLLKAVNSIVRGDFNADIPVSSSDEVGELAASMKLMRNNIVAFQKSLKEKTIKASDLAESLYESRYRMKAIIDNVAHGIVVANDSGVIESVNKPLCEMLGYSEKELVGASIDILISDKYKGRHLFAMNGVNEIEVVSKCGDTIPADIAMTEMMIGQSRYFNAVISDVTERKQADIKLRQERDRAQRYLDTVEVMVVALDLDGRITLINRKGAELAGHSESYLLGEKWSEVCVRPQDRTQFSYFFKNQFHYSDIKGPEGFVDSSESILLSSNFSEKIVSWRYSQLLDESGAVSGLLCSGTDITAARKAEIENKNMQQQLQQSQKMQAIGQLTGGIAHDFNNIIASILGHAELLKIRMASHKDEKAAKYIENIYRSGERARDLVEKMLAFSRGRGKNIPAAIEVESAIQEIINILRSVLPATIKINVSSSGKGVGILASPVDLQQIIMNLCINARDAMNGHGNLDIAVESVHDVHHSDCSSCHQCFEGDYVVISVTDSGVGIASEQMVRLFEPFFTTKDVGKGTGMGLAVVHGIVHELDGHVVVKSTPGRGASFQLYLKASVLAPKRREWGSDNSSVTVVGGSVLVVDDEPLVREFVAELLTASGYTVLLAADPFEALDIVKSKHKEIDAIITDQSMPGITGMKMARIISDMFPSIPIVLSTGYGDEITDAELKDSGIRAMITKPMKGHELLNVIEKVCAVVEGRVVDAQYALLTAEEDVAI
jgi:PAS domain S-box-containing protein